MKCWKWDRVVFGKKYLLLLWVYWIWMLVLLKFILFCLKFGWMSKIKIVSVVGKLILVEWVVFVVYY